MLRALRRMPVCHLRQEAWLERQVDERHALESRAPEGCEIEPGATCEVAVQVGELGVEQPHVTLENLYDRLGQENKVQTLNMILRADVRGSIEAIARLP